MITWLLALAALQAQPGSQPPDPTGTALIACAPTAYEAAIDCLDQHLPEAVKQQLVREGAIAGHFGLGMWLRNNWGLWRGGPLAAAMRARGHRHPDDMSNTILEGLVERLRARGGASGQRQPGSSD